MYYEDLDSVMHVEMAANEFGWARRTFVDSLRENYECWVIDEPYTRAYTIAHAVLGVGVDSAELFNISVAPDYQGRGIGRRLLNHMLELARSHPVSSVFLEVRRSNNRAIDLYESTGFEQVGTRKDYYKALGGAREDARVLRLPIFTQPDDGLDLGSSDVIGSF